MHIKLKDISTNKQVIILQLSMPILIIITCLYRINIVQTPYFSDEIGYWAAGAWINGLDWSPVMSHSGYYGWGYGTILSILFLIPSSVLRFQIALILNMIMILCCYFVLLSINQKLFPNNNKSIIIIISGTTIFYSYNIVYSHLTMCEVFLTFLFVMSVKAFMNICDKFSLKNIIIFIFLMSMQFATHLRTIAIIFAAVIALFFLCYQKKIKLTKVCLLLILLLVGLIFVMSLKNELISMQYTSKNIVERNTVNDSFLGRFAILKTFCSIDVWINLGYSTIGKLFYLGCASFFTLYIGLRYFIQNIIQTLKCGGREQAAYESVYVYIIISFLGSFAISSVSLMDGRRFDHLFYGRYVENTISIIICAGLLQLCSQKVKAVEIATYMLFILSISLVLHDFIPTSNFKGVLPLEISVFAGIMPRQNENYGLLFTIYAAIFSTLIAISVYWICKKKSVIACMVLIITWSIITFRGLEICTYSELERQSQVIDAADEIESLDKKVWALIPEDTDRYIAAYVNTLWLQFHLGKVTINEISLDNLSQLGSNDILIVSKGYIDEAAIEQPPIWQNNIISIYESN